MPEDLKKTIEKLRVIVQERKPVILISGVAGSGKTTTTNELLHLLKFDHRLGTGWIRASAAAMTTNEIHPWLYTYSFRPTHSGMGVFEHYLGASKAILPSVEACMGRAKREGQSLILEGPMLIPGMLNEQLFDVFICLQRSESDEIYLKMLTTGTHTTRVINKTDLLNNRVIEDRMIEICREKGIPIVPYMDSRERVERVLEILAEKLLPGNSIASSTHPENSP